MNFTSILISGLPGSGKSTLVERLSHVYQWPVHSIGQAFREEWQRKYPLEEVPFEAYWRSLPLEEQRQVNLKAKERIAQGSIIYDTRFSIYCKDLPALRVLMTAEIDVRAQRALRTKRYGGKSLREVHELLLQRECDELRIGKELIGLEYDYRNPEHHHIILDSGKLSVDHEAEEINQWMRELHV